MNIKAMSCFRTTNNVDLPRWSKTNLNGEGIYNGDKSITHSKTVNQQRWKTFVVGRGRTPRLFVRCLLLVLFVFDAVVDAAFTPADRTALNTAVQACLQETPDGSCPIFAATNDATGHPYGAIGEWQTGAVTDMNGSK